MGCGLSKRCAEGLFCDRKKRCVAYGGPGEYCNSYLSCRDGLSCRGQLCTAERDRAGEEQRPAEGESGIEQ